ncbi:hypothetical protein L218DRAFT_955977 [Marasmius fiardii PR-910]|nr:hypothetical protein L218DRAFT_955977 [Marasmius fiardii PR-910]
MIFPSLFRLSETSKCVHGAGRFALPWPLQPVGVNELLAFVLPAHLAFYGAAILVTLPNTRFIRLALLPVWLFFIGRLALLDVTGGDPRRNAENMGLVTWATVISIHSIPWGFAKTHYTRVGKGRDPKNPWKRTISEILWDAADLCFSYRGVGWDFSKRNAVIKPIHGDIPSEPGRARTVAFLWKSLKQYLTSVLVFEASWVLIKLLFHEDGRLKAFPTGAQWGFVPLTPLVIVGRAILYPMTTYGVLNGESAIYQLIGVLILGQDPDEWAPLFDNPISSMSLSEWWGYRWHQSFREMFGFTGGRFFSRVLRMGWPGHVLGTFFMSAFYHEVIMWGTVRTGGMCCHPSWIFILNGFGVMLEGAWAKLTGRRVGGWLGRIWMFSWGVFTMSTITSEESCMKEMIFVPVKGNPVVRPFSTLLST